MNILFVTAQRFPCQGGVSSYIEYNVNSLKEKRHQVDIISTANFSDYLTSEDLDLGKKQAMQIEQKLSPLVRRPFVDMEITKNWLKLMYQRVDFSGYDLIHSQDGLTSSVIRSLTTKPLIQTVHSSFLGDAIRDFRELSKAEAGFLKRYDNFALNMPDCLITVSNFIPHTLEMFPLQKRNVIYNGIDPLFFKPKEVQTSKSLRLITVGRLDLVKGYDTLFEAIQEIHGKLPYDLVVCGEGSLKKNLVEFAEKYNLNVQFKGYTDKETTRSLLQQSDVFIQPSRSETFGLAITESMACGCVPICTNVGGIPEQVEHMRNGLLVESQDPIGLAQAIHQLAENHQLRDQLRQEAIFRATTEFTIEQSITQLLDVYTKQLEHVKNQR